MIGSRQSLDQFLVPSPYLRLVFEHIPITMVVIGLLVICLVFSSFSDTNALTAAQQMAVNSLEEFHKNFFREVKDASKNQIMSSFRSGSCAHHY